MQRRLLVVFAGFQLVWLICAVGAGRGASTPGIAAAAAFIAAQVACSRRAGATALTVAVAGLIGFCAESLLAAGGLVHYAAPWPSAHIAPAWIVALWMAFGTTLGTMEEALGRHQIATSAVIGGVFGPISYVAGARIGALTLPDASNASLIAVAAIWGMALPFLILMSRYFESSFTRKLR